MIATPTGCQDTGCSREPDDVSFCLRVSEALDLGYVLYGSPAITFDGHKPVVAQAVVWASAEAQAVLTPGLRTGAAPEWPTSSGTKR